MLKRHVHRELSRERKAILYEVITRKAVDEGMAQRRRTAARAHVSGVTYQVSRKGAMNI